MSSLPEATFQRFSVGQKVRLKASGLVGVVVAAHRAGEEWQYELFMNAVESHVYSEHFLTEDVDDDSVVAKVKRWDFLEPAEFGQALTAIKLRRPLQHNLYSYLASRTDLQPYQFKPVLKLLRSPYGRMFIADEVGLGKTIEAGIVMLELAARVAVRRVLVLCPPALCAKWHSELLERFDQEFEILDTRRAFEIIADPDYAHAPIKAIGSLSRLRNTELIERISESETRFDLVVIDESHHMQNPETASHHLGEQLSGVADHMLMLSATPLSLSTDNLFHQLSILVPEEFFDVIEFRDRIAPNQYLNQAIRALRSRPPRPSNALEELRSIETLTQAQRFIGNPFYEEVCETLERLDGDLPLETNYFLQGRINELNTIGHVFTRTRKREVQDHFPSRRAAVVKVQLTPPEMEFYEAVTEFVRRQSGDMTNFLTVMPQRQVASSIPAAREYLRERWEGGATVEADAAVELDGDAEEGDALSPLQHDNDAWTRLMRAWRAAEGVDSKFEAFFESVRGAIENGTAADGKILVFSFFRKTIEHLARRLSDLTIHGERVQVSVLYGPTKEEERHRIIDTFRNQRGPHVVIASEIASEGLDFEFVNVMVNYDLPWNPMRVEQRIGRLDRYGQNSPTIHIVNFSVADTIEERILERLYTRIGIFESAIGDLESILGAEIQTLTRELLQPGRTPSEETEIIDQVAENIIRRRDESERFERESQALLGQDDVFTEQLNRIERDRRYVGPEEIRNFVRVALKTRYRRIRIGETDGVTTIEVPRDGDLGDLMANYLRRKEGKAGRRGWRAAARASPGSTWRLTFEPEVAKAQHELDFVTLQHPLVGALLDSEPEVIRPTVALHGASQKVAPGGYLFFLYLLNVHSFRPGLEFLPVVTSLDGNVDDEVSSHLLELIREASTREAAGLRPDESTIQSAWEAAEDWLAQHVSDREAELKLISDQVIDRRIASLQESFDRWLHQRRQLLEQAEYKGQTRIAGLHRGYIRRRETELAEKLRELEGQRSVQIGHELIAGGVLEVERPEP